LTVLFCDLVGSTELSGRLDPEELHEIIRNYQKTAAEVIQRHGGHIAQFLGDGIVAYFGYPVAHEDEAQRATRAALEIVAAVKYLAAQLSQELQVRVAAHTGLAVIGKLGEESNVTLIGETPNVAARLQGVADPGTVVISDSTYRLVEGFFVCSSLGLHRFKGLREPIHLYSVLRESDVQSRFERAVTTGLTAFISREAELKLLLDKWARTETGDGQVVLLSGEPGIGKSRLLRMMKERTSGGVTIDLAARCSPYYQDSALYPWIEFFQRLLRFDSNDPPGNRLDKLETMLDSFGFSLPDTVPLIAELLSLPADRYPALPITPQRRKQKTFDTIIAWVLKLAEHNPTRLIVEDVHWADPSTMELLGLLVDKVANTRLLVALAFRSEFFAPWHMQPHVTAISLDRLSEQATELMVSHVAGGKLPPALTRQIVETTEGVPLFIEELTRMVLESGILQQSDAGYELVSQMPSLAIPSTLYESLMARLDRLGTAKEVAQIAAVIGREFSFDLLLALSQIEETRLSGALNRLVDAELFEQRLMPSQRNSYRFRHALIRDAAYESLLKRNAASITAEPRSSCNMALRILRKGNLSSWQIISQRPAWSKRRFPSG
jgi:class 3 adenylate cyclase